MITKLLIAFGLAWLVTCSLGCTLGITIDRIKEGSEIQSTYRRDRWMRQEIESGRGNNSTITDESTKNSGLWGWRK